MASNIKVDIVKPTATNGSLSLKGDSSGSATANGITVNSSGNTSITGTTTISSADINGGNIDNTTIGGATPAAGTFTTFTSTGIADNASTTALTIDSSENVGVGTSSPSQKLDVLGSINMGNPSSSPLPKGYTFVAGINYKDSDYQATLGTHVGHNNSTIIQLKNHGRSGIAGTVDGRIGLQAINGLDIHLALGTESSHPTSFYTNGTERLRIDTSGNLKFNSGYGSVATVYGCRAWINFNGTGTIASRASGNVTSITDNGTGDYTVNFTTAMPDANYSVVAVNSAESSGFGSINIKYGTTPTSSAVTIRCIGYSTFYDALYINIAIFR